MLSIEYARYKLTSGILRAVIRQNPKQKYEIENIMERWFMSMYTASEKVLSKSDEKTSYNIKAVNELLEKRVFRNRSDAQSFFNVQCIGVVNHFLNNDTPTYRGKCVVEKDHIKFIDFKTNIDPSILSKLKKRASPKQIIVMVLRYATILSKSQQWSIPTLQYDNLYTNYGARYEGFASPLNSKMLGRRGASFCSAFYDTDKVFGSIGSFFDVNLGSPKDSKVDNPVWVINPPFIEKIMIQTGNRIMQHVNEYSTLMVYLVIPAWRDMGIYQTLKKYEHTAYSTTLTKSQYYYENNSQLILAKFDTAVFVLTQRTDIDYTHINDGFVLQY